LSGNSNLTNAFSEIEDDPTNLPKLGSFGKSITTADFEDSVLPHLKTTEKK